MKTLEDIVSRVGSLPPLPDTALKLMEVMNDPRSSIEDIVEAVRYDQAVTAEVLKLSNSAYFGVSRKIASLQDAVLSLGILKVLQLVMSVHMNSMLSRAQEGYGLEAGALWRHSVAVGLASSLFAKRIGVEDANLLFTAGLLHDIGKVILNEYVAAEYVEIVRRVSEEKKAFVEVEREVLGFSHEEVGGMIGEKWCLPPVIVRCIRYHHAPGQLEEPDPHVDAVYLANCICLLLGIGLGEDGLCSRADERVIERCNLHEHDLEVIGAQTLCELQRVEQIFAETAV